MSTDAMRGGRGLEPERFEDLASLHAPALYRFALSLVRDPQAAEDLVQDTFVRALERREQYRGEAPVERWLKRILHNLAVDRARRSSKEVLLDDVESKWKDDTYSVDSGFVVERAQTREELEDALVRLPFIYRAVVVLHDVEGWTVEEIARTLEIGLPAAKQRLRRGRMMMVTAMAEGNERRDRLEGVPLRCWDARRKVSDYIDDDLPIEERGVLEAHLKTCPTCPPLYACLVGVKAKLDGLRDPDTVIPPGLVERVKSAVC